MAGVPHVPEALPSPVLGCSSPRVTRDQLTSHLLQGGFPDPPSFISQRSVVISGRL